MHTRQRGVWKLNLPLASGNSDNRPAPGYAHERERESRFMLTASGCRDAARTHCSAVHTHTVHISPNPPRASKGDRPWRKDKDARVLLERPNPTLSRAALGDCPHVTTTEARDGEYPHPDAHGKRTCVPRSPLPASIVGPHRRLVPSPQRNATGYSGDTQCSASSERCLGHTLRRNNAGDVVSPVDLAQDRCLLLIISSWRIRWRAGTVATHPFGCRFAHMSRDPCRRPLTPSIVIARVAQSTSGHAKQSRCHDALPVSLHDRARTAFQTGPSLQPGGRDTAWLFQAPGGGQACVRARSPCAMWCQSVTVTAPCRPARVVDGEMALGLTRGASDLPRVPAFLACASPAALAAPQSAASFLRSALCALHHPPSVAQNPAKRPLKGPAGFVMPRCGVGGAERALRTSRKLAQHAQQYCRCRPKPHDEVNAGESAIQRAEASPQLSPRRLAPRACRNRAKGIRSGKAPRRRPECARVQLEGATELYPVRYHSLVLPAGWTSFSQSVRVHAVERAPPPLSRQFSLERRDLQNCRCSRSHCCRRCRRGSG